MASLQRLWDLAASSEFQIGPLIFTSSHPLADTELMCGINGSHNSQPIEEQPKVTTSLFTELLGREKGAAVTGIP